MGRKSKYTIEEKLQAVLDYKNGVRGKSQICNDLGLNLSGTDLYRWVKHYDKYGEIAFHPKERNKEYSKEFKEMVVREFLDGKGTTRDFSSNPEQTSKAFATLETGVRTQEEIKEGQTQGEE